MRRRLYAPWRPTPKQKLKFTTKESSILSMLVEHSDIEKRESSDQEYPGVWRTPRSRRAAGRLRTCTSLLAKCPSLPARVHPYSLLSPVPCPALSSPELLFSQLMEELLRRVEGIVERMRSAQATAGRST